jgi:hypothetical protein
MLGGKEGVITGFVGTYGSGLGYLFVDGDPIPCENTTTVRALADAFSLRLSSNFMFDVSKIVGRPIRYDVDKFGTLMWFMPVEPEEAPQCVCCEVLIDGESYVG